MTFLRAFTFPDGDREFDYCMGVRRKCYTSYYPFKVLSQRRLERIDFEPVTILYGGNGSGKTTALNVMAEALKLQRDSRYNRSRFFEDYIALCTHELRGEIPERSRVITSDDVFDFMLNFRAANAGVDEKREELFQEYLNAKYSDFHFRTMEDYDRLKTVNMARSNTQSRYVRKNLMGNLPEHSNGESAFLYFTQRIEEDGLYLLDEPENSLSPARQQELCQFIEDSARFFHCQFLIATHSPFLLAMRGAKVYDLDANPVTIRRWTELPAVRAYYDFFQAHAKEF